MKSITFRRSAQDGRFYTYEFNGEYQDKPTYLEELAKSGMIFNILLRSNKFKIQVGNMNVTGYTDRYGNKILHFR